MHIENFNFTQLIKSSIKSLAVLIDPDQGIESVQNIAQLCHLHKVDFIFVGGSLITEGDLHLTIQLIKKNYFGPIIIFPGNELMIDKQADAILLLSLISGRNPEFLIGKHVIAAPQLYKSGLEIISTAYILIDGGKETSVSYISNTKPIPNDKSDIALATAMAGEMMGMKCIYLDSGSGALNHVPEKTISSIKKHLKSPLIVGGGIRNSTTASKLYDAGADVIVIGNGAEKNPELIHSIIEVRNKFKVSIEV